MPLSVKRARLRLSATISRSPCTTWISKPVWRSSCVVYVAFAEQGMVELRGRTLSTTPAADFDAERQRDDVQQEDVVAPPLARQQVGLNGRAQRDHLIRIDVARAAPFRTDSPTYRAHARAPASRLPRG